MSRFRDDRDTGASDTSMSEALVEIRAFLARQAGRIALLALVGAALGLLASWMIEDRYRGTALLMVQPPAQNPIDAQADRADADDAYIESQIVIVTSTDVLLSVVQAERLTEVSAFRRQPGSWVQRQLGALRRLLTKSAPVEDEPFTQAMTPAEAYALRKLDAALEVRREGDSNVVRVSVSLDRPRLAARVANATAEAFIANREADRIGRVTRVSGWLGEREAELRNQVTAAEDAVAAFRIKHNLLSGAPGVTLTEQQLTELNTELIRTRALLAERRAAHTRARTIVATGGDLQSLPVVQQSEIVQELRFRVLELERRVNDLSRQGGSNPRIRAAGEELDASRVQLDTEIDRIVLMLANEVETLQAREQLLARELSLAGGASGEATRVSVELSELERRATAYRALYERYLANVGLVEEASSLLSMGFEIVDRAHPPESPYFPPTRLLLVVGAFLGGLAAILLGLSREAMRPGFVTARQVEDVLGMRVLAPLANIGPRPDPLKVISKEPLGAFAEAVRTVRQGLTNHVRGGRGAVVMTTSSVASEGKSTLAMALAASGCEAGMSVLLIDADFRRGRLTRQNDMEGERGFHDALTGRDWRFPEVRAPGGELRILPTGRVPRAPSDILTTDALRDFVTEARRHHDLVVIDAPPIGSMVDAPLLARVCDTVAFVIRWNATPRDVVGEALRRLESASVGIVLNDVDIAEVARFGESYEEYVRETAGPVPGGLAA